MLRHIQILVGVIGEMKIGKSGTFLMEKEVTKDSKRVCVCRKFLLAGIRPRVGPAWIIPHMFSPQPLLIHYWVVCRVVVVVRGWSAESSYSRPDQAPDSKVLKEQSSPALFTKLLEMQGNAKAILIFLPSTRVPFRQGKCNRQYTSSVPEREFKTGPGVIR